MSPEPSAATKIPHRTATSENFPVASWLLPEEKRKPILTFYAFARDADDIADSPYLSLDEKQAQLGRIREVLLGDFSAPPDMPACQLMLILHEHRITPRHALHLIQAFMLDAQKNRMASWSDLLNYCNFSAAPVGRFVLDLYGEDQSLWPYADALCNVLQILNHIQDCGDDFRKLDRIYLPQQWMREEGALPQQLLAKKLSPEWRRVVNRSLDRVDVMLADAAKLIPKIHDSALKKEIAVIYTVARLLGQKLRRDDPLQHPVTLSSFDKVKAFGKGVMMSYLMRRPRVTSV
jgi:squalene synthase HpnC